MFGAMFLLYGNKFARVSALFVHCMLTPRTEQLLITVCDLRYLPLPGRYCIILNLKIYESLTTTVSNPPQASWCKRNPYAC
jgi:hypothetical protein